MRLSLKASAPPSQNPRHNVASRHFFRSCRYCWRHPTPQIFNCSMKFKKYVPFFLILSIDLFYLGTIIPCVSDPERHPRVSNFARSFPIWRMKAELEIDSEGVADTDFVDVLLQRANRGQLRASRTKTTHRILVKPSRRLQPK